MNDSADSPTAWTPLVAGVTTVTLTGALVAQFGLPGNWTGLAISLLLGIFTWPKAGQLKKRLASYLISALTIFSIAMGLNSAGIAATQSPELSDCKTRLIQRQEESGSRPFFQDWW